MGGRSGSVWGLGLDTHTYTHTQVGVGVLGRGFGFCRGPSRSSEVVVSPSNQLNVQFGGTDTSVVLLLLSRSGHL